MSRFTVYISQEARVHTYQTVEAANEAEAKDMVLEMNTGSPSDYWSGWEIGETLGCPQVDDICERKDSE